jgi:hypothetical protein
MYVTTEIIFGIFLVFFGTFSEYFSIFKVFWYFLIYFQSILANKGMNVCVKDHRNYFTILKVGFKN